MANAKKYYEKKLPYLTLNDELPGKLIVIEGPDCSGRSTQISMCKEWMEANGHAVLDTGIKRSNLVAEIIQEAKKGNILGKNTLSLLYCTDFADQLENKILPALESGYIVLSDRYIFTLMARDILRGASKEWLKKLFGFAIVPDLVFLINIDPDTLLHRTFSKYGSLDYWEAGMDIHLSSDMFESFKKYHMMLKKEYESFAEEYGFISLNGRDNPNKIQAQIRKHVSNYLQSSVE